MLFKHRQSIIKENKAEALPSNEPQTFEEYLILSKYSINTIRTYTLLFKLLGDNISQESVNRFCSRHNYPLARSFLRAYFNFLKTKEFDIPKIRGRRQKRILMYLEYEDYMVFVNGVDDRTAIMLRLMFECGLRISELLSLTPANFNIDKNEVRGIGKGNKEYILNFKDKTKEMIINYVESNFFQKDSRLFPITRQQAWRVITHDSLILLGRKLHPHALRHSCGTYLRRMGWDLKEIQMYLRHEKLETTGIYTHVDRQNIGNKFKRMEDGE